MKRWFENLKIGQKLMMSFSGIVVTIILFGVYSLIIMGRINSGGAEIADNWLPASIYAGQFDAGLANIRKVEYKLCSVSDAATMKDAKKELDEVFASMAQLRKDYEPTITTDKDRELYNAAMKLFEEYVSAHNNKFMPLIAAGKKEEATKVVLDYQPLYADLTAAIDGLVDFNKQHGLEASHSAANMYSFAVLVTLIILIAFVAIAALLSVNLTRAITGPLNELVEATDVMAKGDMTIHLNEKITKDELGKLSGSFVAMIKSLSQILAKTKDAVNQMTSASNEILAASTEQAAGAREQSSAIAETTSAATELSKSSEQIGESIKRVSLATNHALNGMAKIKDAIAKTGERMTSLSEKSQQIGKITELINDVADQTNLLAVNAAIEAARAGEQGRGFTVVADEIRKLADSTAKSTKDITALIEIIQNEMSNAIMSMEQSVSNVNEEVKLAQESADSAKEIAMSATQQVSGSKQIADAMANINEAMKEIASGAGQASTAAKQMTALAGELNELIARFKI